MSLLHFPVADGNHLNAVSVYDESAGKTQEEINDALLSLAGRMGGVDITSRFTFTAKKRVNYANGSVQSNDYCKASVPVSVDEFESVIIVRRYVLSASEANGIAFYDSSNNKVSGIADPADPTLSAGTYTIRRIKIPDGAKYMRTTWWNDDQPQANEIDFFCIGEYKGWHCVDTDELDRAIEGAKNGDVELPDYYYEDGYIDSRVNDILSIISSNGSKKNEVDLTSEFTFTANKRINYVSGKLQNTTASVNPTKASGFVSVEGFTSITLPMQLLLDGSKANGLMFYTSNSESSYISGSGIANFDETLEKDTYIIKTIPVPDTAKYMRTTWWNDGTEQASEIDFFCTAEETIPDVNVCHHGDQFFWFTDPHYFWYSGASVYNGLNSTKLIRYIQDKTNIRKVFCGGDLVGGTGMSAATCTRNLQLVKRHLSDIWDDLYMIIGNHEWNNPSAAEDANGNMLTIGQIYSMLVKDKEHEFGGLSPQGDYWIDNAPQKIRYICLGASYNATFRSEQIKWFGEALQQVPSGYTVVVLSHVGITKAGGITGTFAHIAGLLDAAKGKTSYTFNTITFDYSEFDAEIACVINGHIHEDHTALTPGGIRIIATTCDRGPTSSQNAEFDAVRQYKTITEQAIDVFIIDTDDKTIKTIRIGGSFDGTAAMETPDRTFSY